MELADHLWTSRYILQRISEVAGLVATLDPNPIPGAASAAPVRFSTRETRQTGSGMREISAHMNRLNCSHLQHMMLYGQHNSRRYSGASPFYGRQLASDMHMVWLHLHALAARLS